MSRKTNAPFLVLLLTGLAAPLTAAAETDVDPAHLDALIQQLDSDSFAMRERAFQQLVQAGAPAIEAVADAAGSEHNEIAWRASRVLERIGVTGDEQTIAAVVAAMERLDQSGARSFAQTKSQMAQRWREFRHRRASTEIARLGGEVVHMPGGFAFDGGFVPGGLPVFPAPAPVDIFVPGDVIEAIEGDFAPIEIEIKRFKDLGPRDPAEDPAKAIEFEDVPPRLEKLKIEPAEIKRAREELKRVTEEAEKAIKELEIKPIRPIEVDEIEIPELPKPEIERPAIELEDVKPVDAGDVEIIEAEEIEFAEEDFDEIVELIGPAFDFGGPVVVWDAVATAQNSHMVRLGENWKGGDEGLALLKDIKHLSILELNNFDVSDAVLRRAAELPQLQRLVINRSRFDHEKLMEFKKLRPNLTVFATGKGLLGIAGQTHPQGFQVTHVMPGSGAEKAGIQLGDVITTAGGRPIKSLDALTLLVSPMNVGDKLEVTLLHGQKTKKVTAILGPREPQILQ